MRWSKREDHGASTCDKCGGKLGRVALGRRPVEGDYAPAGYLADQPRRLGLMLVCRRECAVLADEVAADSYMAGKFVLDPSS